MRTVKVLFFLFLFSFTFSFGQGVIFKKEQANKLFGPIKQSFTVSAEELLNWANENLKVGFKIAAGNLFVVNDHRTVFYKGSALPQNELIHYFDSDTLKSFLKLDGANYFTVELRTAPAFDSFSEAFVLTDVITISGQTYSLELAEGCPPRCLLIKIGKMEFYI